MRSSIACKRCRNSKVKCVNNGVNTTCRACEHSGRECEYPTPAVPGSRRREGSVSGRQQGYSEQDKRPKLRKSTQGYTANATGLSSLGSPRPMLDALDPRLLTPTVWRELFDIFQRHYSADLPFLHPTPFLKPLNASKLHPTGSTSISDASDARPPGSDNFLLAFLALTARFHARLVAHHSPPTASRASKPLIASEYYANCANERQTSLWPRQDSQTNMIDGIQAGLMLGLHEWGMCRGHRAWMRVGMCIRAAQSMGLQYEKDLDDEPNSRSFALDPERGIMDRRRARSETGEDSINEIDRNIAQEIRRRTFWSCYIMDRYLSSGKYRPQMLFAPSIRTQLPASDRSFAFGEKVRTLMLSESDGNGATRADVQNQRQAMLGVRHHGEAMSGHSPNSSVAEYENEMDKGKLQVGEEEGLVSRYVKILELYGKVVHWTCAGGRRTESHPPWDARSEHFKLVRSCQDFKASLPKNDTLTPQNTQSHIQVKDSTPYTLMHTVYLLCQIMLHREYVPFIPLRCSKPEGPLDPPLFPPSKYDVPHGFWEDSARQCFKSARELMDLVKTCQEWNALVETPIVGFSIYTVVFVGIYCEIFPWMDPDGYMCKKSARGSNTHHLPHSGQNQGIDAVQKALRMLGDLRPRLHMADGWIKTMKNVHKYLARMRVDYEKNVQKLESSSESASSPESARLSLREGGSGGGLDEYKSWERIFTEFGDLDDHDIEMTDLHHKGLDDNSNSGATVKSEEGDRSVHPEQSRQEGPWNAINTTAGAGRQTPTSAPISTGTFRSYESMTASTGEHAQSAPPSAPAHSHLPSFRPMYSQHNPSVRPADPASTFASPTSRTASTSLPSPSFIHPQQHQQPYNAWNSQNSAYNMQVPASGYVGPQQHVYTTTTLNQMHSYPNLGSQQAQSMAPAQHESFEVAQVYDPTAKEDWSFDFNTGLSGEDLAAFTAGYELDNYASNSGFGQGWLSQVDRMSGNGGGGAPAG